MRHFLISALLLSLVSGCSSVNIGPHRIDVQQGNALDQENVARLKPGLNRSQVRFLLGTPLVVDPFRTDRWDYVYVYYKAGKLAEQKRITLFFEGDTLARIEGDLPEPVAQPSPPAAEPRTEAQPAPVTPPPPATTADPVVQREPVAPPKPAAAALAPAAVARAEPAPHPAAPETSVVPALPSPKNAPAYVGPRPSAELSLKPETNVAQIKPDVIPAFPGTELAPVGSDAPVLKSLNEWASAWSRRDEEAYFSAYDPRFVPQDGGSRTDWERRRRLLFGAAKNIEVKIDSPSINRTEEGTVMVTFNQFYRSGNYRDAVVKQLHMVERDGRWLIVEEKVLSILRGAKP